LGWSLSDSSELIVDGTVTQADPSLVGSEIWHWDASQMSANSRAHKNLRVTGIRKRNDGFFIEQGSGWQGVTFSDFTEGESSDEDDLSVPSSLEDFTRWEFGNLEFLVGVSDIPGSGNHLTVDNGKDGLNSEDVRTEDETLHHVHLSSLDLVVSVLLVPKSVFVVPVISLGLSVEGISEVGWS
jgi:hypothetical protein